MEEKKLDFHGAKLTKQEVDELRTSHKNKVENYLKMRDTLLSCVGNISVINGYYNEIEIHDQLFKLIGAVSERITKHQKTFEELLVLH